MTKDELIAKQAKYLQRIKSGERQLIPELWELLRPLTAKFINRYVQILQSRGNSLFDESDLWQEAYIALIDAIDYYEPERGAFSNCYLWKIKNATRSIRGRDKRGGTCGDPLLYAVSLDKPLDDDTDTLLQDTIPDDSSAAVFEQAEHRMYASQLRQALDGIAAEQLTERQREVIRLRYYDQYERQHIARCLNISENEVFSTESGAIRVYRQPNNRRKLQPFLPNVYDSGMGAFRRRQMSVVEYYIERLDRIEGISKNLCPETRERLRRERVVCELMQHWNGTAPKFYLENWEQYAAGKTDELLGGEQYRLNRSRSRTSNADTAHAEENGIKQKGGSY